MKKTVTKMNKYQNRKNLFKVLVGGICMSFVLYGFGITGTTLSIADAKTNNKEIVDLQTEIAELEIEYFERVNSLSMDEAFNLGMEEEDDILYARIDEVKSVAYNL